MGVGVYQDDYNGTGRSLLIDGPLEEYPLESPDLTDDILDAVEAVRVRVGLETPAPGDRFNADTDMRLLADGRFEIGLRGCEHDYVLGFAPNAHLRELLEDVQDFNEDEVRRRYGADGLWHRLFQWGNAAEILVDEFGLPAPEMERLCADIIGKLHLLTLWELQAAGFECRYPTSSWTSSAYVNPFDHEPEFRQSEMERIAAEVKADMARLDAPAIENLKSLSPEQRVEILKMTDRSRLSEYKADLQKIHVLVPYAVKTKVDGRIVRQINLYDLTKAAPLCSTTVPESLKGPLEALLGDSEDDEYQPLPDTPEWAEWWDQHRAKEMPRMFLGIIASAQDIAAVWKDDIILHFEDLGGEPFEVDLLEGPAPVSNPAREQDTPAPSGPQM